ncbi:hypothetical protein [Alistipes provencensis]|uniref:hypothetical protein n=1 Tax=Alistipes provencensis TaxID=1816676 RepID=UPI0011C9AD87|nr:hypothetical protein [Alistipes provencensis]
MNLKIQTFNKYFDIYSIYKKVDVLLHNFDFYINYLIESPKRTNKYYEELDECRQKVIDSFSQIEILFDKKTCDTLQRFPELISHHCGLYAGIAINVEELISNKKEEYEKLLKSRRISQLRYIYSEFRKNINSSVIDLTYDSDGIPKCRKEYDAIHNTGVIDVLKSKCELYR